MRKMTEKENSIDFVMTWVDGSDKEWQREKAAFTAEHQNLQNGQDREDDREERFRDWDLLRYWFRGVEKYAPWVRNIFFVTWGHLPEWLDTDNPKLRIVKHSDYIPQEFLPTFNSHTIEWNLHRIPELSEQFVYFNDDMFFLKAVKPEDFFVNGRPKDMLAFQPVVANEQDSVMPYIYLNNAMVLAKYFRKRENVKQHPGNYFHIGYPPLYFFYNLLELAFPRYTGFYSTHGPAPHLKETYRELWEKEEALLTATCSHRLRHREDVNQYLIRDWTKLSGNFVPANIASKLAYFNIGADRGKLLRTVRKRTAHIICMNDGYEELDFEQAAADIRGAMEEIFPEKSSFEK